MVFCREAEDQPPLSRILPHLYLGAERDVTQDSLGARGISYVLSVSRCSPQPAFLPVAQYLRIPIDDSLRDDLLPWIPAALRFIDGAMSSGGAVLVHCAAGISRSPALAVAYIMYSMGMDLDHAYRFVKERRPSISPNFNFLGQLQHFQGSLSQKSSDGSLVIRPLDSPLNTNHPRHPTSPLPSPSAGLDYQGNRLPAGDTGAGTRMERRAHTEGEEEEPAQRCVRWGEVRESPSGATRSLSGKLRTLNLTLNLNHSIRAPCEPPSPGPCCEPTTPVPTPPAPLQLPAGRVSLLEKRKSLTLSLSAIVSTTPTSTPSEQQTATPQTEAGTASIPGSQPAHVDSAAQYSDPPAGGVIESAALEAKGRREQSSSSSCKKSTRPAQGSPQGPAPQGRAAGGRAQGKGKVKRAGSCTASPAQLHAQKPSQKMGSRKEVRRGEAARRQHNSTTTTIVDQQPSAETKKTSSSAPGPEENVVEDQSPLSPLNLTINKLLGWGERMLLGVLLGPQIKMGQAALPYRC